MYRKCRKSQKLMVIFDIFDICRKFRYIFNICQKYRYISGAFWYIFRKILYRESPVDFYKIFDFRLLRNTKILWQTHGLIPHTSTPPPRSLIPSPATWPPSRSCITLSLMLLSLTKVLVKLDIFSHNIAKLQQKILQQKDNFESKASMPTKLSSFKMYHTLYVPCFMFR